MSTAEEYDRISLLRDFKLEFPSLVGVDGHDHRACALGHRGSVVQSCVCTHTRTYGCVDAGAYERERGNKKKFKKQNTLPTSSACLLN